MSSSISTISLLLCFCNSLGVFFNVLFLLGSGAWSVLFLQRMRFRTFLGIHHPQLCFYAFLEIEFLHYSSSLKDHFRVRVTSSLGECRGAKSI